MDYRTYQSRLDYLLELIEKGRFRSIGNAASRFGCSVRTVARMIAYLREQGHPIEYNRLEKKYIVKKPL